MSGIVLRHDHAGSELASPLDLIAIDGSTGTDPDTARAAALVICDRATDADDARELLAACGLIPGGAA